MTILIARASLLLVVGFFCFPVTPAHAQTDFSGIPLAVGDSVHVVFGDRTETSGRVSHLSPTSIGVGDDTFTADTVQRLERRGDPLWNGVVSGALAGAAAGVLFTGRSGCHGGANALPCTAKPALVFGAVGLLIDRGRVGRQVVFSAPAPLSESGRRTAEAMALQPPRHGRVSASSTCAARIAGATALGLVTGLPVGWATMWGVTDGRPGRHVGRVMLLGAGAGLAAGAISCLR